MEDIERQIAQRYFNPVEGFLQIYTEDPDGELSHNYVATVGEACTTFFVMLSKINLLTLFEATSLYFAIASRGNYLSTSIGVQGDAYVI